MNLIINNKSIPYKNTDLVQYDSSSSFYISVSELKLSFYPSHIKILREDLDKL